jgi:hypothetical protein
MIEDPPENWQGLEVRVAEILREAGFEAEVGAHLQLARGEVNIDVLARDRETLPPALYLCECKYWRANVPQAQVQAFRTVVADAGAHFGLFISSRGFQEGAHEVVRNTNVHLLNWQDFQQLFVERWCLRYWVPTVRDRADRLAGYIEMPLNDAPLRLQHGGLIEPAEAVGFFVHDLWGAPFVDRRHDVVQPVAGTIWRNRDRYLQFLPRTVAEATTLRALMQAVLTFSDEWLRETGRV